MVETFITGKGCPDGTLRLTATDRMETLQLVKSNALAQGQTDNVAMRECDVQRC